MSDKQKAEATTTRESKRAQFAEPPGSRRKSAIVWVVVILIAAGAFAYFAMGGSSDRPTVISDSPRAESSMPADELRVSLNELNGGRAKFFDYKLGNNQQVRFFVVKSSVGDYRAALDACEVCAHAKKGYQQEGDNMVCRNCGKKFATAMIGKIQGGCHPVGLALKSDGNDLVIKKSELEAGASYF